VASLIAGVLVIMVLAVVIGRARADRGRRRRAIAAQWESSRQEARARLEAARRAVLDQVLELEGFKAQADVSVVYEGVDDGVAQARADYYAAMDAVAEIVASDTTGERSDLPQESYVAARRRYEAVAPALAEARHAADRINQITGSIEATLHSLPAAFEDEAAHNDEAEAAVAGLAVDGLPVPASLVKEVETLDRRLCQAQESHGEMVRVIPELKALHHAREAVLDDVDEIRRQAESAGTNLRKLEELLPGLDIADCEAKATAIQAGFAQACWQGAPALLADARTAYDRAREALAAAQEAAANREWGKVGLATDEGLAAVDTVHAKAAQLAAAHQTLQEAPGRLAALKESAQQTIAQARDYARAHDDDDPVHEQELTRAEQTLASISVGGTQPDWLAAIALARAAGDMATAALASCTREVAQAKERRQSSGSLGRLSPGEGARWSIYDGWIDDQGHPMLDPGAAQGPVDKVKDAIKVLLDPDDVPWR